MLVLGLAHDVFISSAALVRDGRVVAAIAEERLNRQKQYKGFPALAMKECLRLAGASFDDVDVVAVGWNPGRHMEFANYRASNNCRWRPEYLYAIPNMLLGHLGRPSGDWVEERLDGIGARIVFYDHQACHAANAFGLSGFDRAAFLTADGRGERSTTSWGRASTAGGYEKMGEVLVPHSLGLAYGAITQYLGFKPDSDEWKVMALASYGEPNNRYYELLRPTVEINRAAMTYYVDQRLFSLASPEVTSGRLYTDELVAALGPARARDGEIVQRHRDIAWALQRVFEESMAALLGELCARTGERRLVASGGCMMNSVYNGRITRTTPFEKVFVSSCPDDSGISVGAALLAHALHGGPGRTEPHAHRHNYWGPSYDDQIEGTLRGYKLSATKLEDAAKTAADLLADGHLVGWFQGPMEFGQRALGHRSILADPRREGVRDLINAAVKFRESFRPFAPAILAERVRDWFDVPPGEGSVPFMERVYVFREEVRDRVPGVVHADGTGRLQTVEREHSPRFYDLIREFERRSGVPIVLNTSFNLNGEPIVCTPTDAIRTFYSCGLDVLVLGDYLLRK